MPLQFFLFFIESQMYVMHRRIDFGAPILSTKKVLAEPGNVNRNLKGLSRRAMNFARIISD